MLSAVAKSMGRYAMQHKTSTAFGLWQGFDTYKSSREEGNSAVASLGKAGFDAVTGSLLSVKGNIALAALTALPEGIMEGKKMYTQYNNKLRTLARQNAFQSAQFNDTEQVHTMRQAGMAIAQRSKYNMQQAMLGHEASYMMK